MDVTSNLKNYILKVSPDRGLHVVRQHAPATGSQQSLASLHTMSLGTSAGVSALAQGTLSLARLALWCVSYTGINRFELCSSQRR